MGWDLKFNALVDATCDFDIHTGAQRTGGDAARRQADQGISSRATTSAFATTNRFLLVKVNMNDPIPRFTFTRFKQDDWGALFRAVPNAGALRSTLTLMRRQFNCAAASAHATEADYKHCLYGHLKFCTAPCVGNVTARAIQGAGARSVRIPLRPMRGG